MDTQSNVQPPTPPQVQYAQVDVRFLQVILDYLNTRPYGEVFQMVDVLTGRAQIQPQQPPANIQEYKP